MIESVQSLLSVLFGFYDTVFQPLLGLGPYLSLVFFSLVLAALFSVIYKIFLDEERHSELKEKLSDQQEKMKEARENDDQEAVSEHMSKSLELNQQFMMLSLKPMMVTMVFVALIFPWLSSTFSPNVTLEEASNGYTGQLVYAGESVDINVDDLEEPELEIQNETVSPGERFEAHGITWEFNSAGDNGGWFSTGASASVSAVFIPLPFSLWYIGSALNWLGFYIIIAMPLTFAFRKMLGIA